MTALFEILTQNRWLLALAGAHFVLYAIPAWGIVAWRAVRRRLTGAEAVVLVSFAGCVVLEIIQLSLNARKLFGTGSLWGYARYFGSLAPLLWIWVAAALAALWRLGHKRVRLAARVAVVAALGYLFYGQNLCYFRDQAEMGPGEDAWVAARKIAPVIKRDYKGPPRRPRFRHTGVEYFSARRPVVFSNIGAAAWEVRGACEGPRPGKYPYREDYLFMRVGEGYNGKTTFKKSDYDFVAQVDGIFSEWVLLRRKRMW